MNQEDYKEPACPFDFSMWDKNIPANPIPYSRVIEKEDEYLSRNDYQGAERHLKYWLQESQAGGDIRGAFLVHNELMGLYRKLGRKEEAFNQAEAALLLTEDDRIGKDTTSYATACLNYGTVCKNFNESEKAAELYEKARIIYERDLEAEDTRLAGLYNNMALAVSDLGRFDEAVELYEKAMEILSHIPASAPEEAVSCLNLCDTLMARDGKLVNDAGLPCDPQDPEASLMVPSDTDARIESLLDHAQELLDDPGLRHDGNYAFVCEKCEDVFRYYGRDAYADELKYRKDSIYERD